MPAPTSGAETADAVKALTALQASLGSHGGTEAQRAALARVLAALKNPAFTVILAKSASGRASVSEVATLAPAAVDKGKRPVSMIPEGSEEALPVPAVAVASAVAVKPAPAPAAAAPSASKSSAADVAATTAAIATMTDAFASMSHKIHAAPTSDTHAESSSQRVSEASNASASAAASAAAGTAALAAVSAGQQPPGPEVRTIELFKGEGGLGFNIVGGKEHGHRIFVSRIVENGVAHRDKRLKLGDQLLEVNGKSLLGLPHESAAEILKSTKGNVVIKVAFDGEAWGEFQQQVQEAKKRASTTSVASVAATSLATSNPAGTASTASVASAAPASLATANPAGTASSASVASAAAPAGLAPSNPAATASVASVASMVQAAANPLPVGTPEKARAKHFHVKALFNLDKVKDRDCPGHMLSFRAGDVLLVTNAKDDEWWHARTLDGSEKGFIPSRKRVERKDKSKRRSVTFDEKNLGMAEDLPDAPSSSSAASGVKKTHFKNSIRMARKSFFFKKKRAGLSLEISDSVGGSNNDLSGGDRDGAIPTYEVVSLSEPDGKMGRPVIALGHDKDAFYERLIADYPEKFATYIPHTTRAPREDEVDGRDYHFVSREKMEADMKDGKFIEAGLYRDNIYGTSLEAVKAVAATGKHCLLDVSGYAIDALRAGGLPPMVVFLRPPQEVQEGEPQADYKKRAIESARKVEAAFAHRIDVRVDTEPFDTAFAALVSGIERLASEKVWAPTGDPTP